MKVGKKWMPVAGGILDLILCCPVGFVLIFMVLFSFEGGPWDISTALQFVGLFALDGLALVGAILAISRRNWRLALAGSISTFLLAVPSGLVVTFTVFESSSIPYVVFGVILSLFGIGPVVLITLSKSEFKPLIRTKIRQNSKKLHSKNGQ
jgi:hypothetical protein